MFFKTNFPIINLVGSVYYFTGHPSNTISSGDLKCYVAFQKVASGPLEHFNFVDPQGRSWRSPYRTQKNLDYIQIEISKVKPQRNRNIVVPTVYPLSKKYIYQPINKWFGNVSFYILELMAKKWLMEGLPTNIPDLEETWPIFILTKEDKVTIGPTIDVSTPSPLGSYFKQILRF